MELVLSNPVETNSSDGWLALLALLAFPAAGLIALGVYCCYKKKKLSVVM